MHKTSYNGKTAVITGGASGIGLGLAQTLAEQGAWVVIADRQIDQAQSIAQQIQQRGGKASAAELDVRDAEAFAALLQHYKKETGSIDYLFNNAGICISGCVKDYALDDWKSIVDINIMGVVNGIHAVFPIMLEQGFGHIINTASMSGLTPSPGLAGYSTTKHAIVGLSNALRVEAAFDNIQVSVMCPGTIRTDLLSNGGKFGKQLGDTTAEQSLKDWEKLQPMDIHSYAQKALKAVAKNQAIIIFPSWYRLIWWLIRISPLIIMKASAAQFKEQHLDRRKI